MMMKAALRVLAPAAALALPATAPASAEPFNPALVGAEARWVVHIDVERAREADGLRRLLRKNLDLDEGDLRQIEARLGVQIAGLDADDFSFICAYGAGDGHSETAIIGASPEAVEWFASWMSRVGEAQADQQAGGAGGAGGGWTVRSWRRDGSLTAMTTLELPGGRSAMVIADSVDEVVAGARVATGAAPSLADAGSPAPGAGGAAGDSAPAALARRPAPGSIIFLAADGIDRFEGLEPRAVALREAKRLALDFGEDGGRMFLDATITAAGPEQATATRDLLGGLRAWARMAAAQSESASQCTALLDALRLEVEGADVLISWSAEVAAPPEEEAAAPAEATDREPSDR